MPLLTFKDVNAKEEAILLENELKEKQISIINIPEISAVYFALLQCGYDFYPIERDEKLIETIRGFSNAKDIYQFFSAVKQDTCKAYPYWPRAAILETASFFLKSDRSQFEGFKTFQDRIMSAGNISDVERNQSFWVWVKKFPHTLNQVLCSNNFKAYLEWENVWIRQQNALRKDDLQNIQRCLNICANHYNSPVRDIKVILNPIKCVYSADYHMMGNCFIFCSGAFKQESVIHEFLHHVVHPVVELNKDDILIHRVVYPGIDPSYYLTGNDIGRLNAFEEYCVRMLADVVLTQSPPSDLDAFLIEILHDLINE